jgi:drug/metabolite transporter (DMT)-like permease
MIHQLLEGGKPMLRVIVVSIIATLSGAAGQILMRRGMQIVGPLENYAPLELLAYFWRALCQPYVIAGTVMSAIFYFALLAALSWTGVTVAFPLTAFELAFAGLLAVFFLKEAVPPIRWVGIALVTMGVILVGVSGADGSGTGKDPLNSSKSHTTGGDQSVHIK